MLAVVTYILSFSSSFRDLSFGSLGFAISESKCISVQSMVALFAIIAMRNECGVFPNAHLSQKSVSRARATFYEEVANSSFFNCHSVRLNDSISYTE